MKQQAIQLQFDFVDDVQPTMTDRMELAIAEKVKALLPAALVFAQEAFFVAFTFSLVFLAAIIGG